MKYTIRDLQEDFPDDDACLEWIVNYRFPNGITCIKCHKVTKHYKDKGRKSYSCGVCGRHMHPTANTIWHKSSTPLTTWFYVMFVMANTRSGVSAAQVQRETGVTYKCAWRIMHQVRSLMEGPKEKLSGEVEIDETFIHPNPFKRSSARRNYGKDARRKGEVILGIVERGGRAKVWHVRSSGARVILPIIESNVRFGSLIHTDGYWGYATLQRRGYEHRTTNHSVGEFYTPDSSTQNIENLWSHFKRGIRGVYRHVSDRYLQLYAQEYAWRYSHRNAISSFWALMGEISPLSSTNQRIAF